MKVFNRKDIESLKRLKQKCYVPSRDGHFTEWCAKVIMTSQAISTLKARRASIESEALKQWTASGNSVESFYAEVVPELRKHI